MKKKKSSISHKPIIWNVLTHRSIALRVAAPQLRSPTWQEPHHATPPGSKRPLHPLKTTLTSHTWEFPNSMHSPHYHLENIKRASDLSACLTRMPRDGALPSGTYCNFSWKHFVKSQSYIVAPKYETAGPSNHTKQLCPPQKVICRSHVSLYL